MNLILFLMPQLLDEILVDIKRNREIAEKTLQQANNSTTPPPNSATPPPNSATPPANSATPPPNSATLPPQNTVTTAPQISAVHGINGGCSEHCQQHFELRKLEAEKSIALAKSEFAKSKLELTKLIIEKDISEEQLSVYSRMADNFFK